MAASQASAHVDCDQGSDVSNREAVAGNELMPVQFAIHPFETLTSHRSLSFPQEDQIQRSLESGLFPEPKREFAFRWLGDQAIECRAREKQTLVYVRRTYIAAAAAVAVGIIGILVTIAGIWITIRVAGE